MTSLEPVDSINADHTQQPKVLFFYIFSDNFACNLQAALQCNPP